MYILCVCVYVYAWSRHRSAQVQCFMYEPDFSKILRQWNYTIIQVWVQKTFYSKMQISKTIRQVLTCYISNLKSIGSVVVELQASKAKL